MTLLLLAQLALAVALAQPAIAQAQEGAAPARERIGLVLAGGGARGLAHAGVIRALEDYRVPVDAVAGTSMGAVVGGLYAIGYDAAELQRIIWELDWREAFEDTRSRRWQSPRRKSDDYDYATDLALSIEGRELTIPIGMIQGQQIVAILTRLTEPAIGVDDFDDLPTPFRAVATDIGSGEAVVFAEGDLVLAMRASMSIPALLAPVQYEGRLLVDGALASNIPVTVARQMDVDRLIVVDIGRPLLTRDEITDFWDVTDQMVNFLTRRNSDAELKTLGPEGLVITPPLADIGVLDFAQARRIYQIGYESGLAMQDSLAALALSAAEWEAYLAARAKPTAAVPVVTAIEVDDDSPLSDDVIRTHLRQQRGAPLDREQLLADIERIYALGYWELVDYRVENRDSDATLIVTGRGRSRGDSALKPGINLAADLDRSSDLNIGASLLLRGLNRRGGEFYGRGEIGSRLWLSTEFYQPVDLRSRFFVVPWIGYQDFEVRSAGPEFDPDQLNGAWRVRELRAELAAGINLSRQAQLRAGGFRSHGRYLSSSDYGDGVPESDFDQGGVFASARVDDLDDVFFPRFGTLLYSDFTAQRTALGAAADLERWRALGQGAISFGGGRRNTLILAAKAGQTFDAPNEPEHYFQLGGLFNLSGYGQYALSGRQMALATGRLQRRLAGDSVLPFGLSLHAGVSFESGQVWSEPAQMRIDDLRFGGSAYLAVDSPIGPMHLAYGYAGDAIDAFYLTLGWPFLIHDVRMAR